MISEYFLKNSKKKTILFIMLKLYVVHIFFLKKGNFNNKNKYYYKFYYFEFKQKYRHFYFILFYQCSILVCFLIVFYNFMIFGKYVMYKGYCISHFYICLFNFNFIRTIFFKIII